MIDKATDPVAWSLLIQGLEDLREHLGSLTNQMARDGRIDDEDFAICMGHAYAHLNRAWNSRSLLDAEVTDERWDALTQFPTDLEPVG